jgi:hypothetical protein
MVAFWIRFQVKDAEPVRRTNVGDARTGRFTPKLPAASLLDKEPPTAPRRNKAFVRWRTTMLVSRNLSLAKYNRRKLQYDRVSNSIGHCTNNHKYIRQAYHSQQFLREAYSR